MAASGAASASVALVDGERVVWREAFGLVDRATQAAATPATRFAIGSVSKVVAALATMILVERQLVELDAPLVRYLPEFRMASPAPLAMTHSGYALAPFEEGSYAPAYLATVPSLAAGSHTVTVT